MKTLLIVAALCAGVWFMMTKAKQNAEVQKMTQAPERYTTALKTDVSRAKDVEETASKLLNQQTHGVEKAVDAAQ